VLKLAHLRLSGHKLELFRNALVRFLVKMAPVPPAKTIGSGPVGDEPDFLRPINRADNFHPHEARLPVHQMGALAERLFHLGDFVIADDELAEGDKRAGCLCRGGCERGADRPDGFSKWTVSSRRGRDWGRNRGSFNVEHRGSRDKRWVPAKEWWQ
jgi:hypothetical protein